MGLPLNLVQGFENAIDAFVRNPTPATARAVARSIHAKIDYATAHDIRRKEGAYTSFRVPLAAHWEQGVLVQAAFDAASDAFPSGMTIVWGNERNSPYNPHPGRSVLSTGPEVFEASGFNALMRSVYEATPASMPDLLTDAFFDALSQSIETCRKENKIFGYLQVRRPVNAPEAKIFRKAYNTAQQRLPGLPRGLRFDEPVVVVVVTPAPKPAAVKAAPVKAKGAAPASEPVRRSRRNVARSFAELAGLVGQQA